MQALAKLSQYRRMTVNWHSPLSGHPELSTVEFPGYREYRVSHPRTIKQGGTWPQNIASLSTTHALLALLLSYYWKSVRVDSSPLCYFPLTLYVLPRFQEIIAIRLLLSFSF